MSRTVTCNDEFQTWVVSLTTPQLRALCCQSGIVGWNAHKRERLLDLLGVDMDGKAHRIYEENYATAG